MLLPHTKFAGSWINHGTPIPATIAFKLPKKDEWILGVKDGPLKMVKLRVTGPTTYEWISTKYNYDRSSLSSFSESNFVGTNGTRNTYTIQLVAILDTL